MLTAPAVSSGNPPVLNQNLFIRNNWYACDSDKQFAVVLIAVLLGGGWLFKSLEPEKNHSLAEAT
jgi:hypothetical protein